MSPKWFDLRRLLGLSTASTEMSAGAPADDFLENEPVRANMRKHGDDGRIPRPLDHYAYFRSLESRET